MIPQAIRERLASNGTVVLTLHVVPKSCKREIAGVLDDGSLKVKVTAPADKGVANEAVCELLASEFDVPKRNVRILRGETSRIKQVEIRAALAPTPQRR